MCKLPNKSAAWFCAGKHYCHHFPARVSEHASARRKISWWGGGCCSLVGDEDAAVYRQRRMLVVWRGRRRVGVGVAVGRGGGDRPRGSSLLHNLPCWESLREKVRSQHGCSAPLLACEPPPTHRPDPPTPTPPTAPPPHPVHPPTQARATLLECVLPSALPADWKRPEWEDWL